MRVVITRPASDARQWATAVRAAGHEPLVIPLIDIRPISDVASLLGAWLRLDDCDAAMFVSGNAVNGFMMARPIAAAGQMGSPIRTRAWATGPGTRQVLIKNGWPANLIDAPPQEAAQFDSEALWSGVSGQVRPGGKVLVIRGETYPSSTAQSAIQASNSGRDWLVNKIIEAGATPLVFASYWRCAPVMTSEQLNQIEVAASSGALWLFSSSEAIANLMALVPSQKWSGARAVATHPRIAARAQAAGFGRVKLARPTVKDVLASIESLP